MNNTKTVLEHHLDAFGTQDLDAVMIDYDDDSTVITNMGTFSGLDEIRELFSGLFEEFDHPEATVNVEETIIHDDFAYLLWNGETPENDYEFCTDTFHIPEETIEFQTFAGKLEPK